MNKGFYERNKKMILFGGAMIGALALGVVIGKKVEVMKFAGRSVISWRPNGKFVGLEEAKVLLDLNNLNSSQFAIVKDGAEISAVILNNSNVIVPSSLMDAIK